MSKQAQQQRLRFLKQRKVIQMRMQGIFTREDTLDDLKRSLVDFYANKNDKFLSYVHNAYGFMVYNNKEFEENLQLWKKNKIVVLDCNFHERELDGKKFYFFVAQHKDIEKSPSMCPVAMALGFMVSGYTYIIKDKETYDYVKKYLE